jgi:hypothetical protein
MMTGNDAVGDDEIGQRLTHLRECLVAIARRRDLVVFTFENHPQEIQYGFAVVDDEDPAHCGGDYIAYEIQTGDQEIRRSLETNLLRSPDLMNS